MMHEYDKVRQVEGEPRRRWFGDELFDLIVWLGDDGRPMGFQLCYDKGSAEHALTWTPDEGYTHRRVDDGETSRKGLKLAPVLLPDGVFDAESVAARFHARSRDIDPEIVAFVTARLASYG